MQIEEIMKFGGAAATLLGTAIAAIIRSKKAKEDQDDEVDVASLAKEMKELQLILHNLKSDVHGKHTLQLDHIEEDVTRLFDKTDKLTDILIAYFSKQSNK